MDLMQVDSSGNHTEGQMDTNKIDTNTYLWQPPEEECQFKRIYTNGLSFRNMFNWKRWWELFTGERHQAIVSRIDNQIIIEYIDYGFSACEIKSHDLKVRGIPQKETWAHLDEYEFFDDTNTLLAKTIGLEQKELTVFNGIQNKNLFRLVLHDGTQYIIRENNYRRKNGHTSGNPWITIANSSGKDFMGVGYWVQPGLFDDLVYVQNWQNNTNLLLGIISFYACIAQISRNVHPDDE